MIKFTVNVVSQENNSPTPNDEGLIVVALTPGDGWVSGYFQNDKFFGDNDRTYNQVDAWFKFPDELAKISHEGYLE